MHGALAIGAEWPPLYECHIGDGVLGPVNGQSAIGIWLLPMSVCPDALSRASLSVRFPTGSTRLFIALTVSASAWMADGARDKDRAGDKAQPARHVLKGFEPAASATRLYRETRPAHWRASAVAQFPKIRRLAGSSSGPWE